MPGQVNRGKKFWDAPPKGDPCEGITAIALHKGEHLYLLKIGSSNADRAEALRVLGRWASHHDLSFTWHDAAVLSVQIRKLAEQT